MPELAEYSEEELLHDGRAALRGRRYHQAAELLAEYCERLERDGRKISGAIMADFGLAVGLSRRLREGIKICQLALSRERRNPEIYLCLAQLYVASRTRKKAIEMIETGLRLSPEHVALNQLHRDIGKRRGPVIPFLSRDSALNVKLGRLLHRR